MKDHCKAVSDILRVGIPVHTSRETSKALSCNSVNIFEGKKQFKLKSFSVLPFPVKHDVENHGFLIKSDKTNEKLLLITDCPYCEYRFKDINYIMIECNYQADILQENIDNGTFNHGMKKRLLETHMELSQTIGFLRANDLSKVQEIYLIHLSDRNSGAEFMRDTIIKETGKPVFINSQ